MPNTLISGSTLRGAAVAKFVKACRMRASEVLAIVPDVEFELKTLKRHQHTAKLPPGDLLTIDNYKRRTSVLRLVPFDAAAHNLVVCYLRCVSVLPPVFDAQAASYLVV